MAKRCTAAPARPARPLPLLRARCASAFLPGPDVFFGGDAARKKSHPAATAASLVAGGRWKAPGGGLQTPLLHASSLPRSPFPCAGRLSKASFQPQYSKLKRPPPFWPCQALFAAVPSRVASDLTSRLSWKAPPAPFPCHSMWSSGGAIIQLRPPPQMCRSPFLKMGPHFQPQTPELFQTSVLERPSPTLPPPPPWQCRASDSFARKNQGRGLPHTLYSKQREHRARPWAGGEVRATQPGQPTLPPCSWGLRMWMDPSPAQPTTARETQEAS